MSDKKNNWDQVKKSENWELVRRFLSRQFGIRIPPLNIDACGMRSETSGLEESLDLVRADFGHNRSFYWSIPLARWRIKNIKRRMETGKSDRKNKDELESIEENITSLSRMNEGLEKLRNEVPISIRLRSVGLSLSGGGIRSATFNLGVLQALNDNNDLAKVDYLSTVSGGGYIGCALTYLMHNQAHESKSNPAFPFACDQVDPSKQKYLNHIRRHSAYLTPGQGVNHLALVAAAIRGIFINLVLMIPLLLGLLWILLSFGQKQLSEISDTDQLIMLIAFSAMIWIFWRKGLKRHIPNKLKADPLDYVFAFSLWVLVTLVLWVLVFKQTKMDWWLVLLPVTTVAILATIDFLMYILNKPITLSQEDRPVVYFEALAWISVFGVLSICIANIDVSTKYPNAFLMLGFIGITLLAKYLVSNVFFAALSATVVRLNFSGNRYFTVQYGDLVGTGLFFCFLGGLPLYYSWANLSQINELAVKAKGLAETFNSLMPIFGLSVSGVIATTIGWLRRGKGNEERGYVAFFLRIGVSLLLLAAALGLYHVALTISQSPHEPSSVLLGWIAIVTVFLLAIVADLNHVSIHRYYRNRLMEAFFCSDHNKNLKVYADSGSDNVRMIDIDIAASDLPYPIINTTLVTVGSKDAKYAKRGGESFVFTPRHIGSTATGWSSTNEKPYNKLADLATAMSISGAAVDPNMGETKSRPLAILMALLNLRMGYWLPRPNRRLKKYEPLWFESWLWLIGCEMFRMPNEDLNYVRLSDGGHFDNLGIYELVRRRCRIIIVSDATADANSEFKDLARASERIRVDFGAEIDLDVSPLHPTDTADRCALRPYVIGKIRYKNPGQTAILIYVKTTKFEGLPHDVLGYAKAHPSFPDEATTDQFFSEEQFEAYRELGYRAGKTMLDNIMI